MKKLTGIQLHLTKNELVEAIRNQWPAEMAEIAEAAEQGAISFTLEVSPLPDAFLVLQALPINPERIAQNEPN